MLVLEHGKPMVFGKDRTRGSGCAASIQRSSSSGGGVTEADLLVHDEQADDPHLAFMLSRMWWPEYPVPVGVFRAVSARPTTSS